jgi:hypothetical protein
MPSRPILARVALLTWLLVGLVVLADSVARHELRQAIGGTTVACAAMVDEPASAADE